MDGIRLKILSWVMIAGIVFTAIPLLYINGTREVLNLEQKKNLVFNINTAEVYRNFLLYKLGISGVPKKVVVGKEGWLFLGDAYGQSVHYSRETNIDFGQIEESVSWFQSRQEKLSTSGVVVRQILPPNKLSIYPEYAPPWLELPEESIASMFSDRAQASGLNIVDMRLDLIDRKQEGDLLYYKTDSHWNHDAAYITYQRLMSSLKVSLSISEIEEVVVEKIPEQSGGTSQLLKINGLMPGDYEIGRALSFPGSEDEMCISNLNVATLQSDDKCDSQANSVLMVTTPLLVVNENALNDLTVVWYRDSFGTAMSSLMQGTFKRVWQIPYHYFYFSNVECFAERVNADIVLFMSVERNLVDRLMTHLPGSTPKGVAQSCL
jgi:hypothetical protein